MLVNLSPYLFIEIVSSLRKRMSFEPYFRPLSFFFWTQCSPCQPLLSLARPPCCPLSCLTKDKYQVTSCLKISISSLFLCEVPDSLEWLLRALDLLFLPFHLPCAQPVPSSPLRFNLDFTYFKKPSLVASKLSWPPDLYSLHTPWHLGYSFVIPLGVTITFVCLSPTRFSLLERTDSCSHPCISGPDTY